jgi:hypothetical protein
VVDHRLCCSGIGHVGGEGGGRATVRPNGGCHLFGACGVEVHKDHAGALRRKAPGRRRTDA